MDPNNLVPVVSVPAPVPIKKTLSSAWTIIKKAFAFYKEYFKRLWPLFLLGSLGNVGLRFSNITNSLKGGEDNAISVPVIITILIIGIICAIFLFLSKIALFKSIADIRSGQFVSIRDSYKKARTLFWPTVLISFICYFATAGSLLLLIVPGIILSGYLVFSQYELYVEGRRGIQALLASWRLVKGYWWAVVLKMVATGLIIGLLTIATFAALAIPAILIGLLFKGTAASIVVYVVAGVLFALALFLFLAPLSILVIFEIYYDLREVKAGAAEADSGRDERRKKKIVTSVILGVIGLLGAFSIGFNVGFKEAATANRFSELERIVIPHDTYLTAESYSDLFTIDYPASWHKAGESVISNPEIYVHEIYFVPNDKDQASSTMVTLLASSLPKGISDLDSFKGFLISAIEGYPDRKVTSMVVSTTTISVYPALELSYDMEDTATSSPTAGTYRKVSQKVFLRGDFYYMVSYEAAPEHFSKNMETVKGMIDSFYLYYTHGKAGELGRYVNRDYGFKIDYPSDWLDVGSVPDHGRVVKFTKPLYDVEGNLFQGDNIRVFVNYHDKDLESFVDAAVRSWERGAKSLSVDQNEPMRLSGHDATRLSLSFRGPGDTATSTAINFFVPHDGKVYTISFTGSEVDESLVQKIANSFEILDAEKNVDVEGLAVYENRQFGHTIAVPKEWSRIPEIDILNGIAEAYMPLRDPNDTFVGVMSLGVIDADLYPRSYPITDYRDDQVLSWKQWYGESKGFKVKDKGSIVVDGNQAAYFTGSYKGEFGENGELPPNLKVKQVFVDKDNMKRWLSYIDDEVDFEKNVVIFDRAVESFTWR